MIVTPQCWLLRRQNRSLQSISIAIRKIQNEAPYRTYKLPKRIILLVRPRFYQVCLSIDSIKLSNLFSLFSLSFFPLLIYLFYLSPSPSFFLFTFSLNFVSSFLHAFLSLFPPFLSFFPSFGARGCTKT